MSDQIRHVIQRATSNAFHTSVWCGTREFDRAFLYYDLEVAAWQRGFDGGDGTLCGACVDAAVDALHKRTRPLTDEQVDAAILAYLAKDERVPSFSIVREEISKILNRPVGDWLVEGAVSRLVHDKRVRVRSSGYALHVELVR